MSKNVSDRYLDTTKNVLQVDSSHVGLGAVLLQDGKLANVRYANIETEMLVIVLAYLKYNYYCYGRRFECKSDHLFTWRKFLWDAPPSLQRVLLTIQPYDFEIKYVPDKEVHL